MSVDGKSAQPSSTVKPTTCLVNLPVHTPPLVHRIQPWEECGFTSSTARDYASVVQILRAAGLSETVQPIVIAGILGRIRGQVNESTDLAIRLDGWKCLQYLIPSGKRLHGERLHPRSL